MLGLCVMYVVFAPHTVHIESVHAHPARLATLLPFMSYLHDT